MSDPMLSIVIPTRNEAANALAIAAAVIAECEQVGEPFELIFIDNASTDATVELLRGLCAAHPRVKLIVNARNFGQMRSPTHGIFQARGAAVIGMCADFQDPPALIPQFVRHWRAGADIVLGVRESERSGAGLGFARRAGYAMLAKFGDAPAIPNATGFGLYDARAVRAIAALSEPEPFFRGLLVETGYTIATIPYPRPPRAAGRSNNDFLALADFALSGLASSSRRLLRLPFALGVVLAGAALLALAAALVAALLGGNVGRWLWLALFESHFALLFGFLGLFGDQLRLVAERTRGTPLVIERERVNFAP